MLFPLCAGFFRIKNGLSVHTERPSAYEKKPKTILFRLQAVAQIIVIIIHAEHHIACSFLKNKIIFLNNTPVISLCQSIF